MVCYLLVITFSFQLNAIEILPLSRLLGEPWSQIYVTVSPPSTCLHMHRTWGSFGILKYCRCSWNLAKPRSRNLRDGRRLRKNVSVAINHQPRFEPHRERQRGMAPYRSAAVHPATVWIKENKSTGDTAGVRLYLPPQLGTASI